MLKIVKLMDAGVPLDLIAAQLNCKVTTVQKDIDRILDERRSSFTESDRDKFIVDSYNTYKRIREEAWSMFIKSHDSKEKLIALENTHNMAGGTIWPLEEISKVRELATEKRLRLHLDGARLWNACVASGIAAAEYGRAFDSISVCFSKGLGAPAGSAIAGSRELIAEARRCRKLFGGGMRQVGILAAAAIYALENHLDRLAEDHANARKLAENLNELDGLSVELTSVQTNIVVIDLSRSKLDSVAAVERLKREGVLVVPFGPHTLRAVTHLEITTNDIDRAVTAFQKVFG